MWLVGKATSGGFNLGNSGNNAEIPLVADGKIYDNTFLTTRSNYTPTVSPTNATRLFRIQMAGGTRKEWIDNTLQETLNSVTIADAAAPALLRSGTTWEVNEALILDHDLNSTEAADLITYFNTAHGLSVSGGSVPGISGAVISSTWTMPAGIVLLTNPPTNVEGEVFNLDFSMLAGGLAKYIPGISFDSTWVMPAGTVDRALLVAGVTLSATFTMQPGLIDTAGAKLIPGPEFVATFTMHAGLVATGQPVIITPGGPVANRLMKFSFIFRAGTVQHIAAVSVTGQPIISTWTMLAGTVHRGIQGVAFDSIWNMPAGQVSNAPPIVIFGKTLDSLWRMPAGTVKLLSGTFVDLEPYSIEQYQDISGRYNALLPPPTIPSTLAALPDPNTAPTLTKTAGGFLLAGTYRYAYAGWRGDQAQVTAPSPWTVITVANGDKVTMTHPTIPGAEGYLVYREQI